MGNSPGSPNDPAASYSNRRTASRHTFVASTEITDAANASQLSGRVTEISRKGCYVDIVNTLPVGTLLNIRISCDRGSFATKAKILYVQERIGMGILFVDPPKEQVEILDSWLAQLPPSTVI